MLDRSKCKKMLVWGNSSKAERIVIDVSLAGSCIAVEGGYEEAFLSGKEYFTTCWKHYEPIKEPEWKAFTKNKQLEPYIDFWFRREETTLQYKPTSYDAYAYLVLFINNDWYSIDELFDNWEMKVNGIWQPVGELK